jgi:hypothetical protein
MIRLARQLADAALAVVGDIVLDLIHGRLRDDFGLAELERRLAAVEARADEAEALIIGQKAARDRFPRKAAS